MSQQPHTHLQTEQTLQEVNKRTGRNMVQATITAVALILLIIASLVINMDVFVLLIIAFMILALWELRVDFATAGYRIPVVALWLCSVATLLATYFSDRHIMTMSLAVLVSILVVSVAASFNPSVSTRAQKAIEKKQIHSQASSKLDGEISHSRLSHVAVSVFTVLYITLLAGCVIIPLTYDYAIIHAVMLVFLPALSDTGGLFAGAYFGKHKLSPRISPKKSVEGLIGSMLFAVIGAVIMCWAAYPYEQFISKLWVPIVMGVMVAIVGTFGDLCASMIKRDIGIKDMGHLLKGHGGVMDRVDSILIAAPFIAVLLWISGM